ncbi:MAG: NepR family anti-sigma factor [Allorhizobium sp.]
MAGTQSGIAAQLRQLYQSVQDEAIPDRFLSLLEKLDQAERQADQSVRIKDSAQ